MVGGRPGKEDTGAVGERPGKEDTRAVGEKPEKVEQARAVTLP